MVDKPLSLLCLIALLSLFACFFFLVSCVVAVLVAGTPAVPAARALVLRDRDIIIEGTTSLSLLTLAETA
jgi:hypothetical protein